MSLYEILLEMAEQPCRIRGGGNADMLEFDLETKSIFSGKNYIVKNGEIQSKIIELEDGRVWEVSPDNLIALPINFTSVEELYISFISSVPNTRQVKGNFKGKTSDELSYQQLISGNNRTKARYALEGYILLGSIVGGFSWNNESHWFWKSSTVPGLILYKKWLTN